MCNKLHGARRRYGCACAGGVSAIRLRTPKSPSIMSHYIGKTISLISNKGLRYVGILENISAEDATVSLKSVRSFGTEGRMAEQGQPNLEVMPGSDVYEYVVFRGSDVKDLSVLDTPVEQVQPVVPAAMAHQTSAQKAPGPTPTPNYPPAQAYTETPSNLTADRSSLRAPQPAASASVAQETQAPEDAKHGSNTAPSAASPSSTPSATTKERETATKTRQPAPTPASRPEKFDSDFDFEQGNARFQKERLQDTENKPVYDKSSSFFDSISLNSRSSLRWSEERDLNMDTFGEASVRRGRGNYRGRGRGRGRGKGRGRGSYQEPKPEWA